MLTRPTVEPVADQRLFVLYRAYGFDTIHMSGDRVRLEENTPPDREDLRVYVSNDRDHSAAARAERCTAHYRRVA